MICIFLYINGEDRLYILNREKKDLKKHIISAGGIHMKRSNLNFVIDVVAFVSFISLTTTGVLMRYILPPGSGHYSTVWSLDRHEWGEFIFGHQLSFFPYLRSI